MHSFSCVVRWIPANCRVSDWKLISTRHEFNSNNFIFTALKLWWEDWVSKLNSRLSFWGRLMALKNPWKKPCRILRPTLSTFMLYFCQLVNLSSIYILYSITGIFSSTFLLPVYGSKYSIFNWVLKLNLPAQYFFSQFDVNVPLKTCFSIQFCSKSSRKLFHFWDTKSRRGILMPNFLTVLDSQLMAALKSENAISDNLGTSKFLSPFQNVNT
jgi:hypothetical protein